MLQQILQTDTSNVSATILRLTLGIVMWAHGAQKLLGWFGGYGFQGTMNFFTGTVGLPWIIGFLVILIEFFGAILLILGVATRPLAILFFVLAIGITYTCHIQNGFFINWSGTQKGEGYEYFLLMMGLALSLLVSGAGRWSLDAVLSGH